MVRTECTYVQCCGSGVGSRINHVGSGSGQPFSRMNLKKTSLIKFTISQPNAQLKNTCSRLADFTLVYILKKIRYRRNFTNIKCKFAAQLSRGGDQRCRIRNRIRIRSRLRIRSRSRNFLKSRIRIRSRIRNKLFRIHNPAYVHR